MRSFFHRRKAEAQPASADELLVEQLQERKAQVLPWIESPVKAHDGDLTFHLRHEANSVELFFDLFFVANLATFTAYHAIVDIDALLAYIGLFGIIWATWFQVTLHDVRFAIDSVYERACKVIQFMVMIGFALVGSAFAPGGKKQNNKNFKILCWLLFTSRALLAIQYIAVLVFSLQKTKKLVLPIVLNTASFVLAAGAFIAMTPAFAAATGDGWTIYYVWYIVLFAESAAVIGVSSIWRTLSFKKTHLVERMGLLTLIVIGEGAIGVTKTVGKLMGKGINFEGCALVLCIILILVFLWMLYFDNHPHGHYGTVREQLWACLHFPLHLAIVGVVEGSQQIALARYVFKNIDQFRADIYIACAEQRLEGKMLVDALTKAVDNFQLDKKVESQAQVAVIKKSITALGAQAGICSGATVSTFDTRKDVIPGFGNVMRDLIGGLFQANGAKLPNGTEPAELAINSFTTVYIYFWCSVLVVIACFLSFIWLTRHHGRRTDIFDRFAIGGRTTMLLLSTAFIVLFRQQDFMYYFIENGSLLPAFVGMLFTIVCCDRLGRLQSAKALKKYVGLGEIEMQSSDRDSKEQVAVASHEVHH
ncbi:hypothetical protein W97_03236 [Coniosporium apollinis CBS 100218]|uniref:Low temperature requirement A n=1 Tax=Coniosporium apollinis (strain CBS 100218) TaxID=1168221 RepID=R7YQR4_CONA1|nr:uncharacterized protein W97_03236 [Coniosporium apollinis CBS 100218]EON64006.1 hypothetical protein W97_03236 [Coniosporium apollinis CBS 100218]